MEPFISHRKRWVGNAIAAMRHQSHSVDLRARYQCKMGSLSPSVRHCWVQLDYDEACRDFVDSCEDVSWTQSFAATCLMNCFGWSVTDTNGYLGRGQMHVLSTPQIRLLLSRALSHSTLLSSSHSPSASSSLTQSNLPPSSSSITTSTPISTPISTTTTPTTNINNDASDDTTTTSPHSLSPLIHSLSFIDPPLPPSPPPEQPLLPASDMLLGTKLLDVGAGDGNVTQHMASLFASVVATEVSAPMVDRLRQRGYDAILTHSLEPEVLGKDFDCVAFLNVLDRCDKPFTMLQQIRGLLSGCTMHGRPGVLLIAVVLPFRPFVEDGSRQLKPSERFKALEKCDTFEGSVNLLVETVFQPAGFRATACAKVPYVSRGDMSQSFYLLSDAVFVLEPIQHDE